ncbi:MAG TPA: class I SAM-dependent methyltransferase [Mycobacteriales bacterium]|nr:class I SAM-dependent methyltransferase [Mycobacteriales bacterium]
MSAFDGAYWEDRYRSGAGTSRRGPSPSLVAEAAALRPGRALDAGCGTGGDALWLAARGWQVTAVDVSATALEAGRQAAAELGLAARTSWVHADLTTSGPGPPGFDLVSSHYVHVPGPFEDLVRRLATRVAPGGRLLVVGHAAGSGDHPGGAQVDVGQVLSALPAPEWRVRVAEPRTHVVHRPGGARRVELHDVVVVADRT